MDIVTLDFETYWSREHSLSKMSNIEYVMHPDTEIISCAIKINDAPTQVVFGRESIAQAFEQVKWNKAFVIGHNMSEFDSLVLAWRFGIRPRMWGCTLAMARPIHAKSERLGLGSLVEHYGIGVKNNAALVQTQGKKLSQFTPDEIRAMRKYNADDADQCFALFGKLRPHFSAKELLLIDMTIRSMVEPRFLVDHSLLERALRAVQAQKKSKLLELAGNLSESSPDGAQSEDEIAEYMRAELASAPKFAALLEQLGVPVPMKPSPSDPDKQIPALAKTDEGLIALQEHDDDLVSLAASARLGVKSVQLETRIEAFLKACDATEGYLPVPLKYCGADTTGRWSGANYNCFSGGVEVLTPSGWVRFDAWRGEPIMQWWPDGRLTFEENPARLEKGYDGTMYAFRGPLASFTVTPEHRLVSVRDGRVRERTAQQVAGSSGLDGIPAAGVWHGEANSMFTPAEVRLLVAIAADGCVVPRAKGLPTIQLGFRRHRKIERMRRLLADVGIPYYERAYSPQATHTGDHDTVTFVIPNCPYQKGFGSWILRLGREALDAFVDELPHWDGQRHHKNGNTCFWTSSVLEAEWCSTALHLSGTPATVRTYAGNKVLVYARSGKFTAIETDRHVTPLHHSGKVYCAGVESSYIMVRFDSRISVVGQCQNLPRINPAKRQLSDALRLSIMAPDGYDIIVADQSGIELRVNHFLWKVESSMRLYQADPEADLYRAFAAARYGIPPEEVDKAQRQLAKVCVLEGTLVLTDRGEVPIEQVTSSDRVWDGVEWVGTLGAIYKGERDVITYDGLTATPDHYVWVEDGRKVQLAQAAAQSLRLARTGEGGTPLGFGEAGVEGASPGQRKPAGADLLHGVWREQVGELRQPAARRDDIRPDRTAVGAPVGQAKGRVWDLLNCGPRHRFTAGGRLVSNCQLGLGFGAGSTTFQQVAKIMGGLSLSEDEAQELVFDWRREYADIVRGWRTCHDALPHIAAGREREIDPWGLCHTSKLGIHLPSGRIIRYPALHQEDAKDGKRREWWYGTGRHRTRIYAGKITENIVQALARDTVADNAVQFRQETGMSFALMVHDELVYVTPKKDSEKLLARLQEIMRTPPKWWPELITWSEGDIAQQYGQAK